MKSKAPHIDTAMIERADHFEASIFLGVGRYHTAPFATLAEAREAARQFGETVTNGRKGMVYAVTPEGRSTFVPETYQPNLIDEEKTMTTEITTNLSGSDIAKLTAQMTGGGYKRANSKESAIKRYLSVAAEKGIEAEAKRYLGTDFDFHTAEHCMHELLKGGHASIEEVKANSPKPEAEAPAPKAGRKAKAIAELKGEPASKPAKAPKADAAPKAPGKRAAALEAAQSGIVPEAPDFSAETHKRFRPKLDQVKAMVEARNVAGLKAFEINPISSSPKAIAKYRDLAVIALEAQAAKAENGKAA